MNCNSLVIRSPEELEQALKFADSSLEFLFCHGSFARVGEFNSLKMMNECAAKATSLGHRAIFVWDALFTENKFELVKKLITTDDLRHYSAVRAQDVGVLQYCKSQNLPIQLCLEAGNHNTTGIDYWIQWSGKLLDKLVLSYELSVDHINTIVTSYPEVHFELLALGPILLFYTPRTLLKNQFGEAETILALAHSEESAHKNFPVIENNHGTFMFHLKDYFILDVWQQCHEKLARRYDLLFLGKDEKDQILSELLKENFEVTRLKNLYPRKVMRGFFKINKSDILFSKLKNYRTQRKDEHYIGEVLQSYKGEFFVLELKNKVVLDQERKVLIITPEGREKVFIPKKHETLSKEGPHLVKIFEAPHVPARSQVYFS